ncbi:M56 family metallopeptidase [Streptomyces sp. NPDC051738]|uniref:M56 family metallopeptidase n=1 Tax=Streptomyces sp. NPDC051738 TaxID=3365672 RepID=UPI0037CCCABC
MPVIAALLAYAALLGFVGDRVLTRASWTAGHPRAALRAWHACAFTFLSSTAAALILTAHDLWEHAVVWLFHAGKPQVHAAYAGAWHIEGVADSAVFLLLLAATAVTALAAHRYLAVQRERDKTRLITDALGSRGAGGLADVHILDEAAPTAFCVPGSRGRDRIVVSRGTVDLLTEEQLAAAVAHERGHLRLAHHRMILAAEVVTAAVGWSGALRGYARQVQRLAEMAADDHAAAQHGSRTVASALLEMCTVAPSPGSSAALALSGPDPAERIRRLLAARPEPRRRLLPVLIACATVAVLALPAAMVLAPAFAVADTAHCGEHCPR